MWKRKHLKKRAKAALRNYYWRAFLVNIMLIFISGGMQATGFTIDFDRQNLPYQDYGGNWILPSTIIVAGSLLVILFFLGAIVVQIFIFFPLQTGAYTYYKRAAEGYPNLNDVIVPFQITNYGPIVRTMVWRAVVTFLWFLVFIIPGFIKMIGYCFVPFILADNPQIGHKRALQLSYRMTYGHKWGIVKLICSFFGWWIAGLLAGGIGVIFVLPYIYATLTELYITLRREAVRQGITNVQELRIGE